MSNNFCLSFWQNRYFKFDEGPEFNYQIDRHLHKKLFLERGMSIKKDPILFTEATKILMPTNGLKFLFNKFQCFFFSNLHHLQVVNKIKSIINTSMIMQLFSIRVRLQEIRSLLSSLKFYYIPGPSNILNLVVKYAMEIFVNTWTGF